jgi:hypothetical protein
MPIALISMSTRNKNCELMSRGIMKLHKSSSANASCDENKRGAQCNLEAVPIGTDLIAFYPREMHRPQPYVILLAPSSGILKGLELPAAR